MNSANTAAFYSLRQSNPDNTLCLPLIVTTSIRANGLPTKKATRISGSPF